MKGKQVIMRITRNFIENNTLQYYRVAGGTRPDLRVVDYQGKKIVVKDFKKSDILFRLIVGPILIRREYGALKKLKGIKGIPQAICKIDRYAFAIEHVVGESLENHPTYRLENDFYKNLKTTIDRMHERGVAHCDLRSRGNVMAIDSNTPCVVDFAACVFLGRGINPFSRWLFRQFVLADNQAVLRIKNRISPSLMTQEEKAALGIPLPFETPARKFGSFIRNITRSLMTKKKDD